VQIVELWRHPVKSLQGEPLTEAHVDDNGVRGDRSWGVRDEDTGRILTGRREPRLLLAAATMTADDEPEIVLPDGQRLRGSGPGSDEALSEWLGRPVALVPAEGAPGANAEFFADATDDASQAIEWTMPAGRFVDAMALLIVTTASLRQGRALHPDGEWATRRFRPNVVVDVDSDGWVEDAWCGRSVHVGTTVVQPAAPCQRCTMVTRPQPGLDRDVDVFRTLARHHNATFGVWTAVQTPGVVRVGDEVVVA
jgi:uncharacterized protein YcbX